MKRANIERRKFLGAGAKGLVSLLTGAVFSNCGREKMSEATLTTLSWLYSLPKVTREYLLAAEKGDDIMHYKSAVQSVDDMDLKKQVANYASSKLEERAKSRGGFYWSIEDLELAIELEPDEKVKERLIDCCVENSERSLKRYQEDYRFIKYANNLAFCAKYTGDKNKAKAIAGKAVAAYESQADDNIHRHEHAHAAKYLSEANKLRKQYSF